MKRSCTAAAAGIAISAAGYCCAFPPLSLSPLVFFTMIPFFSVIDRSDGPVRGFLWGSLWGALTAIGLSPPIFHAVSVHYDKPAYIAILFIALAAVAPSALLYGLYGMACRYFLRGGIVYRLLIVPPLLLITEYAKEAVPVLIPWGGIGYAAVPMNGFIQIADTVGYYGILYIVVLCNSVLSGCLQDHEWPPVKRPGDAARAVFGFLKAEKSRLLIPVMIVTAAFAYGAIKIGNFENPEGGRINATIVQGNFGQADRWIESSFARRLVTYMDMSGIGGGHERRIVVWPETVLNSAGRNNEELFAFIMSGIGDGTVFISGGVRRDRTRHGVFNTAFILGLDGLLRWYDKKILLPYAESSPFGTLLGRFYEAPSEFLSGSTPSAVDTGFGKAGLSICFEVLYPRHIRRSVRDGASFLVNLSNDGWFGNTSEPEIHLNAAVMRAVETRRYMLRASNNGISAAISPTGRIIAKTGLFTRETVSANINELHVITPYVLLGDLILYFSAFAVFSAAFMKICKD